MESHDHLYTISIFGYIRFGSFYFNAISNKNFMGTRYMSIELFLGTQTVVMSCAEGKGIVGEKVHIEDHLQTEGLFEICEVEVQVEKGINSWNRITKKKKS